MRYRNLISCAAALACCGVLSAQQPQPADANKPTGVSSSSKDKDGKPAIRRFSAGGILSFSGFSLMDNLEKTETVGTKSIKRATTQKGYRFGGGGFAQVSLVGKFAVTGSAILHRVNFETNDDTTDGTKVTKLNNVSSADFWEFPIMLRRYSKDRKEAGARWFAEAGLATRRARNVRSSLQTTDPAGKVTCCDERPIAVSHRFATGFAAGGGYQFIDQFGLRFIPSIRYTRWTNPTFNNQSVRSNPNQLEALVTITF